MAMFGRLTGYSREAYLWIRAVPKGMALNCICKAPGIIHRGSVRERMETKTVIKAVVSLVPIGRGQRELMKPLFQLNVKSYSDLPKATEEENGKAKNLTTKSQSSYLNIDLVHVEPALSLRQYCYVNVRRLHVQSALRALNDRMTVDFEERSKHKLQSSDLNREVVEPIVQRQVEDALKIQDPVLRRDILVNLILVEKQNFAIANQQLGTVSEQKSNELETKREILLRRIVRQEIEAIELEFKKVRFLVESLNTSSDALKEWQKHNTGIPASFVMPPYLKLRFTENILDLIQSRREAKWYWYLNNPPKVQTSFMRHFFSFKEKLDTKNLDYQLTAESVGFVYRIISNPYHEESDIMLDKYPKDDRISRTLHNNAIIKVLLDGLDIKPADKE